MVWLFVVLVLIAVAILKVQENAKRPRKESASYEKQAWLFSPAERSFLGVLEQALGQQYRIMGKVRLADIIKPKVGSKRTWQRAFNQIQSKHIDFVACDPATLTVKFVIELDDASHNRPDRQDRDDFLNKALQSAGIPVYHFAARRTYSLQEIQKTVLPIKAEAVSAPAQVQKIQEKPGLVQKRSELNLVSINAKGLPHS